MLADTPLEPSLAFRPERLAITGSLVAYGAIDDGGYPELINGGGVFVADLARPGAPDGPGGPMSPGGAVFGGERFKVGQIVLDPHGAVAYTTPLRWRNGPRVVHGAPAI